MTSNEAVLAAVVELKEQVQRIADAMERRQNRKSYQAEYYKKRKAAKAAKLVRLENTNRHCLKGRRDNRLPHEAWALKTFVERGLSPYNYITWLAWAWNQNTSTCPSPRAAGTCTSSSA